MDHPGSTNAPQALDYGQAPRRRWRILRRAMLVICIIGTVLLTLRWGPAAWTQMQILYWQRQCMNYVAPADQIVHEAAGPEAEALLGAPGYALADHSVKTGVNRRVVFRPECWDHFLATAGLANLNNPGWRRAIVFLGRLQTPSGQERLVAVEVWSVLPPRFIGRATRVIVVDPATPRKGPSIRVSTKPVDSWLEPTDPPKNLRAYAGQHDPTDPTRFSFRYRIWEKEDVVDGQLHDNGHVSLTPRNYPPEPYE